LRSILRDSLGFLLGPGRFCGVGGKRKRERKRKGGGVMVMKIQELKRELNGEMVRFSHFFHKPQSATAEAQPAKVSNVPRKAQ